MVGAVTRLIIRISVAFSGYLCLSSFCEGSIQRPCYLFGSFLYIFVFSIYVCFGVCLNNFISSLSPSLSLGFQKSLGPIDFIYAAATNKCVDPVNYEWAWRVLNG